MGQDTKTELAKGTDGDFARFPQYSTEFQNSYTNLVGLTAEQVNLLAAQAEFPCSKIVTCSRQCCRSELVAAPTQGVACLYAFSLRPIKASRHKSSWRSFFVTDAGALLCVKPVTYEVVSYACNFQYRCC